jgi:actin-related protein
MHGAKEEFFAKSPCCTVVDTGYSFTHVTPFFDDQKINYAIKR